MKIAESEYTVEGQITGDRILMDFDAESLVHLMGVLINLYEDSELAVIREYSTNARDSHVEAGQTRPIEVTLPSALAPFFKVRDWGIGLSVEEIEDIYSKYGASTKRDTNDQVGALGLGCKSGLAYTNQFTLVTVKDGQRAQVVVAREESGVGSMTVTDVSDTNEPNGVEVIVAVRRENDFERKARNFFRFWEPGTVLVNDQPPHFIEGLRITDRLLLIEGEQDYVVMGNVPYPTDIDTNIGYGYSLAAFVGIGDVDIKQHREALDMETIKTKEAIKEIEAEYTANIAEAIGKTVDQAKNPLDAVRALTKWDAALPSDQLPEKWTFQGGEIPTEIAGNFVLIGANPRRLKDSTKPKAIPVNTWSRTIWVYGYDRPTFTAGQRKKINKWAYDNAINWTHIVLCPKKPRSRWLDKSTYHPWEDIKAIKLPRAQQTRDGRISGSYDVRTKDDASWKETLANEIDQTKPIFYCWDGLNSANMYRDLIAKHHDEYSFVYLFPNRVAKFERNFPQAVSARDEAQRLYKEWSKGIWKRDRIALHIQDDYWLERDLKMLDPRRIDDPDLRKAARLVDRDVTAIEKQGQAFSHVLGVHLPEEKWENPLDRYPLYDHNAMRKSADHVYLYLNAAYAARQEDSE